MSDKITKVCDNPACNAEKQVTNNWYRITSKPPFLTIEPGENAPYFTAASFPVGEMAVYDACGESCVAIIVSKVLGVRKAKIDAR